MPVSLRYEAKDTLAVTTINAMKSRNECVPLALITTVHYPSATSDIGTSPFA